ncbi:MAG TPA: hypothetical protein VGG75_21540 [Trebonia sp.]|jgi:ketosteroid isomerase-like protein
MWRRVVDMATAEGVQQWLDGFGDALFDYEIRDLEVVAGGDVAFAYGLARMGSAGQFSLWFRMTFGLRSASTRPWWTCCGKTRASGEKTYS